MTLDLASLASVRRFVGDFGRRELPPLRAIVCNAGIQIVSAPTHTEDGFETTFAVNHLGHFLLVNLLLRHLVAPARIVLVSSGTHDPEQRSGMPSPRYPDARKLALPETDPEAPREAPGTAGPRAYTTSKLCNVLCTYELSRRLQAERLSTKERPITANAFDPGMMPGTGLARDYGALARFGWKFVLPVLRLLVPNVNGTRRSGRALARLVTDPRLEGVSGRYFQGFRDVRSSKESYDAGKAAELWETSAALVQLGRDETPLPLAAAG
jgi:NAD(P)-dependent dehydrogenase (short-subunit alcohol dehydrogenase family)